MITELRLHNFKCFNDAKIDFSQFNLFAGMNGRGKSTILQSLLLVAQSIVDDGSIEGISINGKFVSLGNLNDIVTQRSNIREVGIGLSVDNEVDKSLDLMTDEAPDSSTWLPLGSVISNGNELVQMMSGFPSSSESKKEEKKSLGVTSDLGPLQELQNVYFVSADRKGPVNEIPIEKVNGNIGIHGENVLNVLNSYREIIPNVQKVLQEVLTEASLNVEEGSDNRVRLFIDSHEGSNGFKPVNVGFGYSYILSIIVTVLMARNGAKIFIENPEAHLHPYAQSHIMDFIVREAKKKDFQFFIETHSEHVLDGLRRNLVRINATYDALIYFFGKEYFEKITIDNVGNLSDFPTDFFDQMQQDLREISSYSRKRR